EETPGQSRGAVLLVQLGRATGAARGAGARSRQGVARRGLVVPGGGTVGGGSDRWLHASLVRGRRLLRRQTITGLSRPDGMEPVFGGEGAPEGVVRGQRGGAVVCPDG